MSNLYFLFVLQEVHLDHDHHCRADEVKAAAHDSLHVSLMPRVDAAAPSNSSSTRATAFGALAPHRHCRPRRLQQLLLKRNARSAENQISQQENQISQQENEISQQENKISQQENKISPENQTSRSRRTKSRSRRTNKCRPRVVSISEQYAPQKSIRVGGQQN